jgi:ubiquitin-protein ligase E3 C
MIRRNYIYEDAFDRLSVENEPNLKLKMRVQLINIAGMMYNSLAFYER